MRVRASDRGRPRGRRLARAFAGRRRSHVQGELRRGREPPVEAQLGARRLDDPHQGHLRRRLRRSRRSLTLKGNPKATLDANDTGSVLNIQIAKPIRLENLRIVDGTNPERRRDHRRRGRLAHARERHRGRQPGRGHRRRHRVERRSHPPAVTGDWERGRDARGRSGRPRRWHLRVLGRAGRLVGQRKPGARDVGRRAHRRLRRRHPRHQGRHRDALPHRPQQRARRRGSGERARRRHRTADRGVDPAHELDREQERRHRLVARDDRVRARRRRLRRSS